MKLGRRNFLQGCCAGMAAAYGTQLTNVAFGAPQAGRDALVVIFLRGGMDALSFLPPYADSDYHVARAELGIDGAQALDLNGLFGLHPRANKLKEIYDAGHLVLIPASGSTNPSRSHFEAQDLIERGTPDDPYYDSGGWLARHLQGYVTDSIFSGLSHGSTIATALEGYTGALAFSNAGDFTVSGDSGETDDMRRALRSMYTPDANTGEVAVATLDASDIIEYADPDSYTPANGVVYPNTSTARALSSIAQMLRLELGLQAVTVDVGGWDTHESQADNGNPIGGRFASNVQELCDAMHAFWNDLTDYHNRLTLIVMSEFGRRLKENNNRGTDHGRGGLMMVMNANFRNAGVLGSWPGLHPDVLFERVDVPVTTDYRTVLAEILDARRGDRNYGHVFPGFQYSGPLGLFLASNSVRGKSWMQYQ